MASDLQTVLQLEVPIIVELGRCQMRLGEVVSLSPGAIIDLHKPVTEELALKVNNKTIGSGEAVKVDENFGLRVTFVGDVRSRIEALRASAGSPRAAGEDDERDAGPDEAESDPDQAQASTEPAPSEQD